MYLVPCDTKKEVYINKNHCSNYNTSKGHYHHNTFIAMKEG